MEVGNEMLLHFIHIAGTRMIALGIDGLSCGSLLEGVMVNPSMLDSVPLHLSTFQWLENNELLNWFRGWMEAPADLQPLTLEQWYWEGQGLDGGAGMRRAFGWGRSPQGSR